jgi:hypothetical protein
MAGPFDRVFADVRKDLPSIPDAVVRQEIFRVLDDFTQHTNIWRENVLIQIVPNNYRYTFTTLTGKPSRLMFVYVDPGLPYAAPDTLPPTAPPDAPPVGLYWPMRGITMREPGVLLLPRLPGNAANWIAVVAKRTAEPLDPSNYPVIDEWIVDKYADTLGRGIIARLQFEPQKPYSNPMLAKANQAAYISGRSMARVNDGHANVFDAQNWTFPQGWATVTRKPWT